MLPKEVSNLFSNALARVWETSVEKANATFDGEHQEVGAEIEISAYRQRANNAETARSTLQIECAVLQEKRKDLQMRFDAAHTKKRVRSRPLSQTSGALRPIRKRLAFSATSSGID